MPKFTAHHGFTDLVNDRSNSNNSVLTVNTFYLETTLNNVLFLALARTGEAYYIKKRKPLINTGLKANRELFLFK